MRNTVAGNAVEDTTGMLESAAATTQYSKELINGLK